MVEPAARWTWKATAAVKAAVVGITQRNAEFALFRHTCSLKRYLARTTLVSEVFHKSGPVSKPAGNSRDAICKILVK